MSGFLEPLANKFGDPFAVLYQQDFHFCSFGREVNLPAGWLSGQLQCKIVSTAVAHDQQGDRILFRVLGRMNPRCYFRWGHDRILADLDDEIASLKSAFRSATVRRYVLHDHTLGL